MNFDQRFVVEALAFFDARRPLEFQMGSAPWALLDDNELRALAFADRSRAMELASPGGLRLSDNRSSATVAVRFVVLYPHPAWRLTATTSEGGGCNVEMDE